MLFLLVFNHCSLISEEVISMVKVKLLSPPDNFVTKISDQTFWWEPVKGAEVYNLQIVIPDLTNPHFLILDTTITNNAFSYSLNPGEYEWRVNASNSAYSTQYTKRSLLIVSPVP